MIQIGLRIPGSISREIPLGEFAQWCKDTGFDAIDLGSAKPEAVQAVHGAGLALGTIDLSGTQALLSADAEEREKGIESVCASLEKINAVGGDKAFVVFFPKNAQQSRRDSFENWKQSFPTVIAEAERLGVRIAVEGWPGPNDSALGVTPETLRAMFAAVPSEHFGINYDPSHLVRVGVDYLRVLDEFAGRVIHAHGKDTAIDEEGRYRYGTLGTTFDKSPGFGSGDWRYCIPGEGSVNWANVCGRLHRAGYEGVLSLELEDFRYNGSVEGEKRGLSRAREFLAPYL